MNGKNQDKCCTWTSRSWAKSTESGTKKQAHAKSAAAQAGSICMCAWMTHQGDIYGDTARRNGGIRSGFLWFAVCWYAAHGIKIERILTDNGACYKSARFRQACKEPGIRRKRTRPYRPQTNGKAERFIRTPLQEWAYAQTYTHSWQRTASLPVRTQRYNFQRPHGALGKKTPASRLPGA